MSEVAPIMIGSKTATGMSAVSRVIKSASDPAVGGSIAFTSVGKHTNGCEDNESEEGDCVGVGPDWEVGSGGGWRSLDWRRVLPRAKPSQDQKPPIPDVPHGLYKKWRIGSEDAQPGSRK